MCGVVGVFGVTDSLSVMDKMTIALDHRGQQGAGVVLAGRDGRCVYERSASHYPRIDLALRMESQNIDGRNFFAGISHLRYGTSGSRRSVDNTQPLYRRTSWGEIYVAHNGDTPYYEEMKRDLLGRGMLFLTDSDTEIVLQHIGLSKLTDSVEAIKHGLRAYRGTYAITMLIKDNIDNEFKLIAARDPSGNRPLALGKLDGGHIIASESSAFETVGGEFLREIQPNELLIVSDKKLSVHYINPMTVVDERAQKLWHCVFENVYFSHPSSTIFGIPVDLFREELGRRAARRFGHLVKDGDILTNPPDSSNFFADGFCKELDRHLEKVFIKRHGASVRSFTQESDETRDLAIRIKFSILRRLVEGKRVWIKDDSVVRGRTARRLVRSLRNNGAVWVGVIAGFPPLVGPCHKGIDMDDLIASRHLVDGQPDIEQVRKEIEADFLGYLAFEDLTDTISSLGQSPDNFCFGCLQNKEPIWKKW